MAFVVEDGTGLENATSYISETYLNDYWTDRGVTISNPSNEVQAALIKATDYIDRRFEIRFVGMIQRTDQGLSWPRVGACYHDGRPANDVPPEVQKATAEYAYRALTAELAPDPSYDESGREVAEKDEKVDVIRERTRYAQTGSGRVLRVEFRAYPMADHLLKTLLENSRSRRLVRGS